MCSGTLVVAANPAVVLRFGLEQIKVKVMIIGAKPSMRSVIATQRLAGFIPSRKKL